MDNLSDGYLEYAIVTTLPDGSKFYEPEQSKTIALGQAARITQHSPNLPPAYVARRVVVEGPWEEGIVGDDWGVKRTWDDGYSEVEEFDSRARADRTASLSPVAKETCKAVVVSRRVTVSEWVRDSE
ncbi:hypothetical protein Cme02nite_37970 [Catellatospora methionotrophica]|uniref:Uncharacterized protein n=1 Tax=Catellatospora methionotrophica TaxID=121620 RepID=A0A8J3LMN8_9ACTN|nr:hypothetical protein [Catellatospora methionotrophica]GIG15465.1 hypothetical protein Cme02nite_37970 [Catellatospora methionotrophica]